MTAGEDALSFSTPVLNALVDDRFWKELKSKIGVRLSEGTADACYRERWLQIRRLIAPTALASPALHTRVDKLFWAELSTLSQPGARLDPTKPEHEAYRRRWREMRRQMIEGGSSSTPSGHAASAPTQGTPPAIGRSGQQAAAFAARKHEGFTDWMVANRSWIEPSLTEGAEVFGTLSLATGIVGGALSLTGIGVVAGAPLLTASAAFGAAAIAAKAWSDFAFAYGVYDATGTEAQVYKRVRGTATELALFGAGEAMAGRLAAARQYAGSDQIGRKAAQLTDETNRITKGINWVLKLFTRWRMHPIVQDPALAFRLAILDKAFQLAQTLSNTVEFAAKIVGWTQPRQYDRDGALTGPFFPGYGPQTPGTPTDAVAAVRNGAVVFINGIQTTYEEHCEAAQVLAFQTRQTVVGVYNATAGQRAAGLVRDLGQTITDKIGVLGMGKRNPSITGLKKLIRDVGDLRQRDGGLKLYAHSQGSIIVSEALRELRAEGSDLSGLDVTTFGNAAWTMPQGIGRERHFAFDSDTVSTLTGSTSLIGRWMPKSLLGWMHLRSTADNTFVQHHRGAGIAPHGIWSKEQSAVSYMKALPDFLAEEDRVRSARRARGQADDHIMPRDHARLTSRSMDATSFAWARLAGFKLAEGISHGYDWLDRHIPGSARAVPVGAAPGMGVTWNEMDMMLRWSGSQIMRGGTWLGRSVDQSFESGAALQRSGQGTHPDVDPATLRDELLRRGGTGASPDTGLRQKLSGHLGFDPGGARLHTGPAAAAAARSLKAEAFTIGRDVFFGASTFDPASGKGLGLIAHELTHVGQQTGTIGDKTRFFTQHGGDAMEQEAQQTATRVLANAGRHDGLFVEDYVRVYESEDEQGITQTEQQRLDRISLMALQEAERFLRGAGVIGGASLETLSVQVDLDLNEMSDAEAARVWAEAIVQVVSHIAPTAQAVARPMSKVQRWGSPEHVELGDASGATGRILLDCHKRDLPDREKPPESWSQPWRGLYESAPSDAQKKALQEGLTYGEIVALSGDFYRSWEELNKAPLREVFDLIPLIRGGATTAQLQQATGGRYLALAKENESHFSNVRPGHRNRDVWHSMHRQAIEAAMRGDMNAAWGINAAADHFLTDAFSGGHLRVPRYELLQQGALGQLESKVLHDLDNNFGVAVINDRGDSWIAYGDDNLNRPDRANNRNRELALEAVRLSKQDLQEVKNAQEQGGSYTIPAQFRAEALVPRPADPTQDRWTGRTPTFGIDPSSGMAYRESDDYTRMRDAVIAKEGPDVASGFFTDDDDIRDWVAKQSSDAIGRVAQNEKIRLINVLLDGWVSDEDLEAVRKLVDNVTSDEELRAIQAVIEPRAIELIDFGQRTRLRLILRRQLSQGVARKELPGTSADAGSDEQAARENEVAVYHYNMVENPGPLAKEHAYYAGTFAGGRYNAIKLEEDIILYQAGKTGKGKQQIGDFFTREMHSEAYLRTDMAVRYKWLDKDRDKRDYLRYPSVIESIYAIRIPKGTVIYEGPAANQGDIHIGGGIQIVVPNAAKRQRVRIESETKL